MKIFSTLAVGSLYSLIMLLPREFFFRVPGGDNAGHIYMSFVLTIIGLCIFCDKKIEINLIIIFVFLTLIEFLQVLTTRNFLINDLLFNFVGYIVATLLYLVSKFIKTKLQN
jgi:VanZ family protein